MISSIRISATGNWRRQSGSSTRTATRGMSEIDMNVPLRPRMEQVRQDARLGLTDLYQRMHAHTHTQCVCVLTQRESVSMY